MERDGSPWAAFRDLEYRCHFIGSDGVVAGLHLFASDSDAAAVQQAIDQLRERTGAISVELWKKDRLIARYPSQGNGPHQWKVPG
jgi:hypothetical protein